MKRKVAVLLIVLLIIPALALAEYVGSSDRKIYHLPSCKWAKKIKSQSLVKFKTKQEAEKAGYRPCKVCKP